jgi:very-short-patch-repair endonuclease
MQRRLHGGGANLKATANSMRTARAQRRSMSLPEVLLWRLLRRSPNGVRFRRQYAVGPYVADFYCPTAHLIVEIDGIAHDMGDRPERDVTREEWLRSQGFEVMRIPAKAILNDAEAVADGLVRLCGNA